VVLAARARAAHAAGSHNASLHNMLRVGFTVCYQRQNWVWQAAATTRR
jgi:hypothetical protein